MFTTLPQALPSPGFAEYHSTTVDASPDAVWAATLDLRWSDLRLMSVLMRVRTLGRHRHRQDDSRLLETGPVRVAYTEAPRYVAAVRVARPWKRNPEFGPMMPDLDTFARYDEPNWLKIGLDFRIEPLADGRTKLSTSTMCEATDENARREFARYWRFIRPFSGLIRIEMLRAIARKSQSAI